MRRLAKHLSTRSRLDDSTCVHDGDPVGKLVDDCEIVRHVDERRPAVPSELAHEVEHARLGRDVETRGRFVENNNSRPARERHGDCNALLLAARELERITPQERALGGKANSLGELLHPSLSGRSARTMNGQDLGDLLADALSWIEARRRVLRDVRDRRAPHPAPGTLRESEQVVRALEHNGPSRDARPGAGVPEQGERGAGLAATRLPDEPQHFARRSLERDLVHDLEARSGLDPEFRDGENRALRLRHPERQSIFRRCGRRRQRQG